MFPGSWRRLVARPSSGLSLEKDSKAIHFLPRPIRGDERGDGVVTSEVEPPVSGRVRRAFGLLERVAPGVGARWAVELWCTPPAVEMSLRMPPGVSAGRARRGGVVRAPDRGRVVGCRARRVPGARPGRLPRAPGGLRQTARRGRTPGHRIRSAQPQRVGPRRTRAGAHHDRRVRRSGAGNGSGARSGEGHRGALPRRQGRGTCGVVGDPCRTAGVPGPDGRLLVVSGPVRRSVWLRIAHPRPAAPPPGPQAGCPVVRHRHLARGRPCRRSTASAGRPRPRRPGQPLRDERSDRQRMAGRDLGDHAGLGRLAHYRILRHRPAILAGVDFVGRAHTLPTPGTR